jgi:hypothetical protein
MDITQVTVSFKRTQSLPGYCNVSSGLTLTAEIDEADDYLAVEQQLRSEVEVIINDWIDAELELAGQPARYSADPRYSLLFWQSAGLGVIIPDGWPSADLKALPGSWSFYHGSDDSIYTGQRLPNLQQMSKAIGLYCPEYQTIEELCWWTHYYLSTPNLWCIIRIYAYPDGSPPDCDKAQYLGHIAVPGDVYSELDADPALRLELETGYKSAGILLNNLSAGVSHIESVADAHQWINTSLQELHDEEDSDIDF